MLIENNNWIYCFPTLESDADKKQVPPVLAINTNKKGQLIILAPSIPNNNNRY